MERGGKTMLLYVDPDEAKPVAEALVAALRRAKSPRLAVEKVNGEPVLTHPLAAVLREASTAAPAACGSEDPAWTRSIPPSDTLGP